MEYFFVFLAGLCWGSFLNVVAHRLVHNKHFFTVRSRCPYCHAVIVWYDNIPLVSWLLLRGTCRRCQHPITWLYPFIELLTGVMMVLLYASAAHKFFIIDWNDWSVFSVLPAAAYKTVALHFVFLSALIAATRTDLEDLVIPQVFSLWLVPIGIVASYLHVLDISVIESLFGAALGYGILWAIAVLFKWAMGKEGMGEGDMELLAMIGSFLGPLGVWAALMVGSLTGLVAGGGYVLTRGKGRETRIPFGPFLALGAAMYLFSKPVIMRLLIGA